MTGDWYQSGGSEWRAVGEEGSKDIARQRRYSDAFLKPVLERREKHTNTEIISSLHTTFF